MTIFPLSSVGRPKHVRVMAGALEGDLFIGPKAEVEPTLTPCVVHSLFDKGDFHLNLAQASGRAAFTELICRIFPTTA